MTTEPTASESARHLLDRHGLPEDVIDGALCLHAQELAAVQRREAAVWGVDTAAGKHILGAADLIDPTRTPPAAAPVPPPTQTDRRAQLLDALDFAYCQGLGYDTPEALLDAYDVSRGVPVPPPADQTALDEVRKLVRRLAAHAEGFGDVLDDSDRDPWAKTVRADIAALTESMNQAAEAEAPLSPDYEHPACGFHWHGRDGMDIPIRDGQPVCPRCELAKVEKKLAYVQRMRDEVGAECKRRGRIKLEQAERIVRLERELDGVRDQLGKEMLRADDAEAVLRRVAAEEQPAETQWPGERCMLCPPDTRTRHLEDHMVQVHGARPTAQPAVGEQPETQETPRG